MLSHLDLDYNTWFQQTVVVDDPTKLVIYVVAWLFVYLLGRVVFLMLDCTKCLWKWIILLTAFSMFYAVDENRSWAASFLKKNDMTLGNLNKR